VSTLSERTQGLAGRLTSEQPRDLQKVVLLLIDGSEVRGLLYRTPGTRTLDFLNHQSETFLAMTDARLTRDGNVTNVAFVAVNKAHVIRVIEDAESD
jgi:hypothetical protein